MWLTRISIKNPYFATVIMLAIVLLGIMAYRNISIEEFPDIKFPVAMITTNYSGASPEVVETDVSRPLEEKLNTISGVKNIRSYSFEGSSNVIVEFDLSVNPDQAVQDVRDKVSSVAAGFNKTIDTPVVSRVDMSQDPIISITASSATMPIRDITDWAKQVAKKKLQTVKGVGDIKIVGGVERQIRINIEPYKLQSVNLSINDVVNAVQLANENYPAGDLKIQNKEMNVRLEGKLATPADFANIVIKYRNNVPIRLSDVAQITDGQEEYNSLTIADGKRAVGLDIRPADKANVVELSKNIYSVLDILEKEKPAAITLKVKYDKSDAVKASLKGVEETLLEGAILTVIIVFLFLKSWRSTVITGLTLPISLIGTLFAVYICDFTLNMMSLMALSLSVGLLIDDAIVVRENIVRYLHMGKDHYTASLEGTREIGIAVLSTTFTIVAVFLPIGFMKGVIGKFFYQFGVTVTVAVLISLLVSFTLDPMLSSVWHEPKDGGYLQRSWLGRVLDKFEAMFDSFIISYEAFVKSALTYRKTTLAIAFASVIASFMLVPIIGGEFIPESDKGRFSIKFKTAEGSAVDYTGDKVVQIGNLLKQQIPEMQSYIGYVNKSFGDGTNSGGLSINIGSKNDRKRSANEIIAQTRKIVANIGGIEVKNVKLSGGANGDNKPINIEIKGASIDGLNKIANDIIAQISKIKGATDVKSSFQGTSPALNIELNREEASNMGVDLPVVGKTLSYLFAGNKATTWEDKATGENYDVVIQIPEAERNKDVLDLLKVASNSNDPETGLPKMVSLSNITTIKKGFAPNEIDRINLGRNITITGNIDGNDNQAVFNQIQKILDNYKLPDGYMFTQSGASQDMMESFGYAVQALMVGVAFIYMILVAQFRSFTLPAIIMVSLPMSFVGVFLALFVTGATLNMFSVIGIIMLMGLATKNGILLVDYANSRVREGVSAYDAIIEAGKTRFRPILMTTFAMVFGMLPLAMSTAEGSESQKPMAYAIIGGMITSTILTLVVIPVLYSFFKRKEKVQKEAI